MGALSSSVLPKWSSVACVRAARAAIVMPSLLAIGEEVLGNEQLALFAAFGSFATLVLVTFAGTRRDKLIAHVGLALIGSVLVVIGTAAHSSTVLVAVVTLPVTFAVFFLGIVGRNAAAGITGALLAYVLPAASPGTMSTVPDRLAGWLLASVVGTAAVLLVSQPPPGDKLRAAVAKLGGRLADEIETLVGGGTVPGGLDRCVGAKHELMAVFNATPYRPIGLAAADQALANAVELLEWCTSLLVDGAHGLGELTRAAPAAELLEAAATVLRQAGEVFAGRATEIDLDRLEGCRRACIDWLHRLPNDDENFRERSVTAFHAQAIAVVALAIGGDALVAAGLADADWIASARTRWFGEATRGPGDERQLAGISKYTTIAMRHASLRSANFVNSLRGALALTVAVVVAHVTNVEHGFWVVLATLSVLRTNAAATESTALHAMVGTALGFAVGAGLLLAIGTGSAALWVALPVAVFIAGYAPGTAPLAVGQAAFTVMVAVLFNLLVPVGWKVGVIRVEDVALGCIVGFGVGTLFWPRGVVSVVGDDLADAFRSGAAYLSHAVGWILGLRSDPPVEAMPAVRAGLRLDTSLRGFMTEQGAKRMHKEDLWRLVGGTLRLRLTAHAVASLRRDDGAAGAERRAALGHRAELIGDFFEQIAEQVDRPHGRSIALVSAPDFDDDQLESGARVHQTIWLYQHLDRLTEHLAELVGPAAELATIRRLPWWR